MGFDSREAKESRSPRGRSVTGKRLSRVFNERMGERCRYRKSYIEISAKETKARETTREGDFARGTGSIVAGEKLLSVFSSFFFFSFRKPATVTLRAFPKMISDIHIYRSIVIVVFDRVEVKSVFQNMIQMDFFFKFPSPIVLECRII